jgi:hypothetical protein
MIKPDLQKYIQDEAEFLTKDTAGNQMEHIKKLHATCELLITIHEEKDVSKYDLMVNNTVEESHRPR